MAETHLDDEKSPSKIAVAILWRFIPLSVTGTPTSRFHFFTPLNPKFGPLCATKPTMALVALITLVGSSQRLLPYPLQPFLIGERHSSLRSERINYVASLKEEFARTEDKLILPFIRAANGGEKLVSLYRSFVMRIDLSRDDLSLL